MSTIVHPKEWPRPRGYANGVKARGETVFVAGQVGWNARGEMAAADLVGQVRQALENVCTVLAAGGARPQDVVRLTWYVTDLDTYRAQQREIGEAYRTVMGSHYPAMTLVQVAGLVEEGAKVEIEATAVIPEAEGA